MFARATVSRVVVSELASTRARDARSCRATARARVTRRDDVAFEFVARARDDARGEKRARGTRGTRARAGAGAMTLDGEARRGTPARERERAPAAW